MLRLFCQVLVVYVIHSKCSKEKPAVLMTNRDGLSKLEAGSWKVTRIRMPTEKSLYTRVDFDYENGYVYFEKTYNKFYRMKLDGDDAVQRSIANATAEVISMAFDWVHKKFYWLDVVMFKHDHALHVIEPNGDHAKTLTRWNEYPKYGSAMILDPYNKYVYCATSRGIERIGMDGTGRTRIYNIPGEYFTIDLSTQRLYVMTSQGLSSYGLDTGGLTSVQTKYYYAKPLVFFQGMDNVGGAYPVELVLLVTYLCLLNASRTVTMTIYVARYNIRSRTVTEINGGPKIFFDFKIYDSAAQMAGDNQCQLNNGGCQHLCLPKPTPHVGNFTCECADGYAKSGSSCSKQ